MKFMTKFKSCITKIKQTNKKPLKNEIIPINITKQKYKAQIINSDVVEEN